MHRKILTPSVRSCGLFYRPFSSKQQKTLHLQLVPELSTDAKIVIPISMTRYEKNREQFDKELSVLFRFTAEQLAENAIESVDVIATTALHEDWPESKITEIDNHFMKTHEKALAKQTHFFLWNDWMKRFDQSLHQKQYEEIVKLSEEGSEWYKLMVKTHANASISNDLTTSLRYQRQEYAAIRSMTGYSDLVYMGSISPAWSYLYELYQNLPRFVKASIRSQASLLSTFDSSQTVKLVLSLIEQTVTNPSIPPQEKVKLKEYAICLFHAHIPDSPKNNPEPALLTSTKLNLR